jgi:hypothetical protein
MAQKNTDGLVAVKVKNKTVMVDPSVTDDLEFLELLEELMEGNNMSSIKLLKKLFGSDYAKVKDLLRGKNGVVKTTDAGALFFKTLSELQKNS